MIGTFKFVVQMLDAESCNIMPDWSEIELTTVRDVTDSFHRVLYLRYFLWNRWQKASSSSSFKMDASKEIKSMKLCKFSLMSYTYW